MMIDPEFWCNRRVFLTGHTGFKGSWLSLWLGKMSAHLVGYGLDPMTQPSMFDVCRIQDFFQRDIRADIQDFPRLFSSMQQAQPEIVIHMAAQAFVKESYCNPVSNFATNVMGTVHVLEAVRQCPSVRAVLIITSDKCYENREWPWGYREVDPMGGVDPYSASKGCAELVAASYQRAFFSRQSEPTNRPSVNSASARAGNVIGGGDWSPDRLIPDVLRAVHTQTPLHLRYPDAVRPWQHVLEPLSGYLLLAQKLCQQGESVAGGWNFGPNELDGMSVRGIVQGVLSRLNNAYVTISYANTTDHEAGVLKLDSSKARTVLGWYPRWTLAQALDRIVDWDQSYQGGASMREWTMAQIDEYLSAAKPPKDRI